MKYIPKILIASIAVSGGMVFGQGWFDMQNFVPIYGVNAPVFNSDGTPLAGPDFRALLFGGPTTDSMQPATPYYGSSAVASFATGILAGYFFLTNEFVVVSGVPRGDLAWLQVVAWDARLGATYEEVVNLGIGGYGESPLFQARSGGGSTLPTPPAALIGLQSFSLLPIVPEPSTALLLLLGLPWLLWRRHFRK